MKERFSLVHQRMAQAAQVAARDVNTIKLLAVSKTVTPERVAQLVALGQREFGENYIQEGVEKIQTLAQLCPQVPLVWHCIGPIQSNKTRWVAQYFDWVHSIDRLKIAQRLSEQRTDAQVPLQVCLQVNVDDQDSKSGVSPHEALALAREVAQLPRLQLRGLMTIPEPLVTFEQQFAVHQKAKQLFDEIKVALNLSSWDTLSMGMTADLESAIQAGSTLVRVGTAIFGNRN
jgi:pyridoxal phosphate enzyme (YggS family)